MTAVAARRWKTQINENAKTPAFFAVQPELSHNEVAGWGQHGDVTRQVLSLITLRHHGEHPHVARRFELVVEATDEVMANVIPVWAEGRRGPRSVLRPGAFRRLGFVAHGGPGGDRSGSGSGAERRGVGDPSLTGPPPRPARETAQYVLSVVPPTAVNADQRICSELLQREPGHGDAGPREAHRGVDRGGCRAPAARSSAAAETNAVFGVGAGRLLTHRIAMLRGADQRRAYVYAESHFVPDRLPESARARLGADERTHRPHPGGPRVRHGPGGASPARADRLRPRPGGHLDEGANEVDLGARLSPAPQRSAASSPSRSGSSALSSNRSTGRVLRDPRSGRPSPQEFLSAAT